MIFKPRIFISSTFSDNKDIRNDIENYFKEIGAEPLLYEKNLTPSTSSMTYRKNILDSDFVILIMKENYGTRTDRGISGTHEEYRIAKKNRIPIHVYLKLTDDKKSKEKNELIEELDKDQISYYYFKDDSELFKRLKETTFIISEEIMLRKITANDLSERKIKQLAYKNDYWKALDILKAIENMKNYEKNYHFDYLNTSIFIGFVGTLVDHIESQDQYFINQKLDEPLRKMSDAASKFLTHYSLDFTSTAGNRIEINDPVIGEIQICDSSYHQNAKLSIDNYSEMLDVFFSNYDKFKEKIEKIGLYTDLIE